MHLQRLEEAKKRDHRKLGKQLDLFSIQEEAGPGLIFWHPKGGTIRRVMEDWLRAQLVARGYGLVSTPHIARHGLWQTSGHAEFYQDDMFKPMELDDSLYQLKPMNCPFHILIYKNQRRSYRDLPVRLAELGTVYRYERSGVMHGPVARTGLHAGRRAYLLYSRTGRVGGRRLRGLRDGGAASFRLLRVHRRTVHIGTVAPAASTPALPRNGS